MRYTKELVIGVTAIATIICFVWGFNFLKGKNVFTTKRDYYAFYEHVHGLQVGQPVTINGFKIGQVTEINFSGSTLGALLVVSIFPNQSILAKTPKLKFMIWISWVRKVCN